MADTQYRMQGKAASLPHFQLAAQYWVSEQFNDGFYQIVTDVNTILASCYFRADQAIGKIVIEPIK